MGSSPTLGEKLFLERNYSLLCFQCLELDFGMGLCWLMGNVTIALVIHFYMFGLVKTKCRDPGSNRGPLDLQSNALPTALSRPVK